MDFLRSQTLIMVVALLFTSRLPFSVSSVSFSDIFREKPASRFPSLSPSPSPSTSPSPQNSRAYKIIPWTKPVLIHRDPLPPERQHRSRTPGPPGMPQLRGSVRKKGLNIGEKVGLSFLAAAAVLQLAFGWLLIYKKRKIWKVLGGAERERSSSTDSSPLASHSAA